MKLFVLVSLFIQVCVGYVIKGYLDESVLPLSPLELSATFIQLISDSQMGELPFQETSVRANDGYFVFSNVTKGDYELVLNSIYFDTNNEAYKISVRNKVVVNKVFNGHDYKNDLGPAVEYPMVVGPLHRQSYFKKRESFGLLKLLKNPMILISLVSLGVVFVLPKLTESEEFKQYQEEARLGAKAKAKASGRIQDQNQPMANTEEIKPIARAAESSGSNKTSQAKKRR